MVNIWWFLEVTTIGIVRLLDPRDPSYPDRVLPFHDIDDSWAPKEVNVFGHVTTVIEVSKQIWGFMVATNK